MLNKAKFADIMTGLADMYKDNISEFMLDIYYNILKDYPLERVEKAIMDCIKNYKYNTMPKPATILEFLEGSKEDKALSAWIQVMEGIKKAGYYNTVEFRDPVISHCIDSLGGWQWLCSQDKSQLPFIEKRFLELYQIFMRREIERPILLIGYFDAVNCKKGYDTSKVVKIGYGEQIINKAISQKAIRPYKEK